MSRKGGHVEPDPLLLNTGRFNHACMQCRRRKQKCGGFTSSISCMRCLSRGTHCSFQQDVMDVRYNPYARPQAAQSSPMPTAGPSPPYPAKKDAGVLKPPAPGNSVAGDDEPSEPAATANQDLSRQVQLLTARILELEQKFDTAQRDAWQTCRPSPSGKPGPPVGLSQQTHPAPLLISPTTSSRSTTRPFTGTSGVVMTDAPLRALHRFRTDDPVEFEMNDPIAHEILTSAEAQVMFMLFFSRGHPNAPFLDRDVDSDSEHIRANSMLLYLAILCVGARFWSAPSKCSCWLFPRYPDLVRLLDAEIMRVTLRPKQEDHKLETVQALILCAHWMPLDISADGERYRSRFSEAGAWHILSLAIRWATSLELEKSCWSSFARPDKVTRTDARIFRTMLYLTESDHYLALSARRPCSLSPEHLNNCIANFSRCSYVQPTDLRMTTLFQVAACANLTRCRPTCLEDVEAFDENVQRVERSFFSRQHDKSADAMNQHFPFISLLWYRLSYTSTFLDNTDRSQWTTKVLMSAVGWAYQILHHLSSPLTKAAYSATEFKHMDPDPGVVAVMSFAIDHYFVVVTYAAFFLVSCWLRKLIDADLHSYEQNSAGLVDQDPRSSLLFQLLDLAARTLEAASPPQAHLARRYVSLIHDMADTVLAEKPQPGNTGQGPHAEDKSASSYEQASANTSDDLWAIWQQIGLEAINWTGLLESSRQ